MNTRHIGATLFLLLCVNTLVLATEIPLQIEGNWRPLNYKNIPANTYSETEKGLKIEVNSSASPLIYVFDTPQTIQSIRVNGEIGQLPVIPANLTQGDTGADDFPFRLGLVFEGDKTLNFAQKLIAPAWVKTLYGLAPENTGVDHVLFLSLANPGALSWKTREHPSSKGLFKETIVQHIEPNQAFEMNYDLPQSASILALWISSDGDDTASDYALTLKSITVN